MAWGSGITCRRVRIDENDRRKETSSGPAQPVRFRHERTSAGHLHLLAGVLGRPCTQGERPSAARHGHSIPRLPQSWAFQARPAFLGGDAMSQGRKCFLMILRRWTQFSSVAYKLSEKGTGSQDGVACSTDW